MNTMGRADHDEHGGTDTRMQGPAGQQPGEGGDVVSTVDRGTGEPPHNDHACRVYREDVKSGMMPTPAQPVSEVIHERSAERL